MHVGMIMDGNRRFAKKLMKEPWKGHEYGEEKFEEVLKWCEEFNVNELTLYTFSLQNFNRPKHEFDYLMNIIRKTYKKLKDDSRFTKGNMKVRYLGRIDLFPQDIQDICHQLEEQTKDNSSFKLNFCFGYGGREEVVDAVHAIAEDVKAGKVLPSQVDEDLIDSYVYLADQPDFIIRTGGDKRTSNFLIWQSAYSEWFFLDKMWPELEKEDFATCMKEFENRNRRFGR